MSRKTQIKERRREREEQRKHSDHQTAQQRAFQDDGKANPEMLRELTNTQLDDETEKLLANVLSKDFVLGNLNDAEKDEIKWLLRNVHKRIASMHPPQRSFVKGKRRSFFLRSRYELKPLDDAQEEAIWQAILGVFVRVSRSVDGWQQDKMLDSIAVTERREVSDDDNGGLFPGR